MLNSATLTTNANFTRVSILSRLLNGLLAFDASYREKTTLRNLPDHRLCDLGLNARDVTPEWNPPVMFLR